MVLQKFCIYMASIYVELDAMDQECPKDISQEASQCFPKYEVGDTIENFECQPCGIFEGLLYHQEDEVIDPIIFADTVGLGNRIKKLVSSNFIGIVRSVLVIFETGATY